MCTMAARATHTQPPGSRSTFASLPAACPVCPCVCGPTALPSAVCGLVQAPSTALPSAVCGLVQAPSTALPSAVCGLVQAPSTAVPSAVPRAARQWLHKPRSCQSQTASSRTTLWLLHTTPSACFIRHPQLLLPPSLQAPRARCPPSSGWTCTRPTWPRGLVAGGPPRRRCRGGWWWTLGSS
jgi:hypothetical protein